MWLSLNRTRTGRSSAPQRSPTSGSYPRSWTSPGRPVLDATGRGWSKMLSSVLVDDSGVNWRDDPARDEPATLMQGNRVVVHDSVQGAIVHDHQPLGSYGR